MRAYSYTIVKMVAEGSLLNLKNYLNSISDKTFFPKSFLLKIKQAQLSLSSNQMRNLTEG